MSSPLGIDLDVLDEAVDRLTTALELVGTIRDAAVLLNDLIDDPDDPVAPALEAAARMSGNGADPPEAPAELEAGAGASSSPAPPSSPILDNAGAGPTGSRQAQTQPRPAPAPRRNSPGTNTDTVLRWLEAHPGEWHQVAAIAAGVGLSKSSVQAGLYSLRETETAEHNGEATTRSRWRLHPDLIADDDVIDDIDLELDDDLDTDEDGQPAPSAETAPAPRPVPFGIALQGPQADARAELKRRIKAHLLDEASTISELALALDVPRRDVAPVTLELEATDPDVVKIGDAFRGRGETIYSNIA